MIGDRIKELRTRNNLTQTDLAKRLQLSRSAVNAWEMGISIPSTQYVIELARLFKTSTDYLLDMTQDDVINISELDTNEKELISQLLKYFSEHRFLLKLIENRDIQFSIDDIDESEPQIASFIRQTKESSYTDNNKNKKDA